MKRTNTMEKLTQEHMNIMLEGVTAADSRNVKVNAGDTNKVKIDITFDFTDCTLQQVIDAAVGQLGRNWYNNNTRTSGAKAELNREKTLVLRKLVNEDGAKVTVKVAEIARRASGTRIVVKEISVGAIYGAAVKAYREEMKKPTAARDPKVTKFLKDAALTAKANYEAEKKLLEDFGNLDI